MNDKALITLVIATLNDNLAARGFGAAAVKQAYQPRQQGANIGPGLYVHKLSDRRVGSPRRSYVPGAEADEMNSTQAQQMETTYQVMALWKDDPNYTANDLAKAGAAIIQSDAGQAQLWAQKVGVLRITDVRGPFFTDDFNQFEASPSFDFVLTHKDIFVSVTPAVTEVESGIHRV